jgi:type I restriction enzyme, S subunit
MSWDLVRLGDVLFYEQPTKYLVESENYNSSYLTPVLTAGKTFILGYTNEREGIYEKLPAIIFDDFTTETKYVDFPFKAKSSAMKILTCDAAQADIKFLYYFLQTIQFDAEQHKRYWISTYANFQIPLPPLPVQKRIAEILDAADALRRKDQELLNKYDELAQAIFIDMFGDPVKNEKGWEVKRLGEIFDIQLGKMLSSNLNKGTQSKKYLRNINVQWGIVNTDDLKEMLFTDKELDKFRVEKGDILICEGGAVGRTAVYRNSEEIYFQKSLHRLRPKETGTINATYFEGFMRSAVSNGLLDKIVVSATIAHLTLEKLKELEIIHPDFETQNRYAKAIEIIRHSKNSECANILFENLLCHLVNRNMSKE